MGSIKEAQYDRFDREIMYEKIFFRKWVYLWWKFNPKKKRKLLLSLLNTAAI